MGSLLLLLTLVPLVYGCGNHEDSNYQTSMQGMMERMRQMQQQQQQQQGMGNNMQYAMQSMQSSSMSCDQRRRMLVQQWQQQQMQHMYEQRQEENCFYSQCLKHGSLAGKFRKNLAANDENNDGQVIPNEFYLDFVAHYDFNQDGCCSRAEWVYRWITVYNFTVGYAEARLNDIVGDNADETCLIRYDIFQGVTDGALTNDEFVGNNTETLIEFCDRAPERYHNNCDCVQIPAMCMEADFKNNRVCVAFMARGIDQRRLQQG